jgi:putative DNA modification/repair radical SAM protein
MDSAEKLGILAAAARYDASCSTSGSARENSAGGIGNAAIGGICHSWSADGRCISLLKVLLSNACAWDCAYCANRRSTDTRRAAFEPEELVRLIIDFYKRNYIEGVLLSSGVLSCSDTTMERLLAVARTLRTRERFNGYIHMKAIPGSSTALVEEAARLADRVSVNIELPSSASLGRIAPDKSAAAIFGPMRTLARASGFEPRRLVMDPRPAGAGELPQSPAGTPAANKAVVAVPIGAPASSPSWSPLPPIAPAAAEPRPLFDTGGAGTIARGIGPDGQQRGPSVREARRSRQRRPGSAVLPAGQTTQLVVGASPESDAEILVLAENLYLAYDVRRVYYSAFVPVSADPRIPAIAKAPLLREHRLYQADWLFRFYGFTAAEVFSGGGPSLDEDLDPKCAWALRNLASFPVDLNRASYAELLRVPGIGPVSASRILRARRGGRLRAGHLASLGVVVKRARWFLVADGVSPGGNLPSRVLDDVRLLRAYLADPVRVQEAESVPAQPELDFGGGE